jgi:aminopeptidase N
MPENQPQLVSLKDYRPFPFLIDTIDLHCALHEDHALIRATLAVRRREGVDGACRLQGRSLELIAITLDGHPLPSTAYAVDPEGLTLLAPPATFTLEITTRIRPQENTSLEGLYRSNGLFCTQCEAEGFRKITYFPDRPDVLSRFTTTLEADFASCPVLLANGNRIQQQALAAGRHSATWQDPFPKPCYLFAMVAGDLAVLRDRFVTNSGRPVALEIYSEHHNADKCGHAMRSLKEAMTWDERRFGLEYDLDQYMIVAVDDFNAGAMENKGLNIFNSKFVLAKAETATDQDYDGIESVVAHEYFHNWTGNRVTCRDWFQLSLKEGLTVFRDQEFSADTNSRAVHRINDVTMLRSHQFPEDAGPMAHPVRPDAYIEINNFYTLTVYEKGAEVIRMLHTILGEEGFQRGMAIYLCRHDGGAATTDDFVLAMEEAMQQNPDPAAPRDLVQFRRWYTQAGTPELFITSTYDQAAQSFTLSIRQQASPRAGSEAAMLHIPVRMALLAADGRELPLVVDGGAAGSATVLHVTAESQSYTFTNIPAAPVPSLLRGFSAPVRMHYEYGDDQLRFLLLHDQDPFNRWEAGQRLWQKTLLTAIADLAAGRTLTFDPALEGVVQGVLAPDFHQDRAFVAQVLTLPSEEYLAELVGEVDVDAIHGAREFVRRELALRLRAEWLATYQANRTPAPYRYHPPLAGQRRLKNLSLSYLLAAPTDEATALCVNQFHQADNMTDQVAALTGLVHAGCPQAAEALAAFYERWSHEALVMDKWFAIQATAPLAATLEQVKGLTMHPGFNIKNPNKVRALIGAFATNPVCFHAATGSGYAFVAEQVLTLDPMNPHIAARLAGRFSSWRRHTPARQALIKKELERILAQPGLGKGVYEVVSRTLA